MQAMIDLKGTQLYGVDWWEESTSANLDGIRTSAVLGIWSQEAQGALLQQSVEGGVPEPEPTYDGDQWSWPTTYYEPEEGGYSARFNDRDIRLGEYNPQYEREQREEAQYYGGPNPFEYGDTRDAGMTQADWASQPLSYEQWVNDPWALYVLGKQHKARLDVIKEYESLLSGQEDVTNVVTRPLDPQYTGDDDDNAPGDDDWGDDNEASDHIKLAYDIGTATGQEYDTEGDVEYNRPSRPGWTKGREYEVDGVLYKDKSMYWTLDPFYKDVVLRYEELQRTGSRSSMHQSLQFTPPIESSIWNPVLSLDEQSSIPTFNSTWQFHDVGTSGPGQSGPELGWTPGGEGNPDSVTALENSGITHYTIRGYGDTDDFDAEIAVYPRYNDEDGGHFDIGKDYNKNIPAGMNELLRATYHPELPPFYMSKRGTPLPGDTARPNDPNLNFNTYDRSVPKALRSFWYVGPAPSYPGLGENRGSEEEEANNHVIGWVSPRTSLVSYYTVSQETYSDMLRDYSEMKASIEATIATWMRGAIKQHVQYNDPRMLAAYRCLEEDITDFNREGATDYSFHGDDGDKVDDFPEEIDPSVGCFSSDRFYQYGDAGSDAQGRDVKDYIKGRSLSGTTLMQEQWGSHTIDAYWAARLYTDMDFLTKMQTTHRTAFLPAERREGIAPAAEEFWSIAREPVHITLTVLGIVPVYGSYFDGANAIIYLMEREWLMAVISIVFAIVGWGDVLAVGYLMGKAWLYKVGLKLIDNWSHFVDIVKALVKHSPVSIRQGAEVIREAEKLRDAAAAARAAGGESKLVYEAVSDLSHQAVHRASAEIGEKEAVDLIMSRGFFKIGTEASRRRKALALLGRLIKSAEKAATKGVPRVVLRREAEILVKQRLKKVVHELVEDEVVAGRLYRWLMRGAVRNDAAAKILVEGIDMRLHTIGAETFRQFLARYAKTDGGRIAHSIGTGAETAGKFARVMQTVGWGRWSFTVFNLLSAHFSIWWAMEAYQRTLALYESMIRNNIPYSLNAIGLSSIKEVINNPGLIQGMYTNTLVACPSINSSDRVNLKNPSDKFNLVIPRLVSTLVDNIGLGIPLIDTGYSTPLNTPLGDLIDPLSGVELPEGDFSRPEDADYSTTEWDDAAQNYSPDPRYEFGYDIGYDVTEYTVIDPKDTGLALFSVLNEAEYQEALTQWGQDGFVVESQSVVNGPPLDYRPQQSQKDTPGYSEFWGTWEKSLYEAIAEDKILLQTLRDGINDSEYQYIDSIGAELWFVQQLADEIEEGCNPEFIVHLLLVAHFAQWFDIEESKMYWGKHNEFIDLLSTFNLLVPFMPSVMIPGEITVTWNTIAGQMTDESGGKTNYDNIFDQSSIDSAKVLSFIESFEDEVQALQLSDMPSLEDFSEF